MDTSVIGLTISKEILHSMYSIILMAQCITSAKLILESPNDEINLNKLPEFPIIRNLIHHLPTLSSEASVLIRLFSQCILPSLLWLQSRRCLREYSFNAKIFENFAVQGSSSSSTTNGYREADNLVSFTSLSSVQHEPYLNGAYSKLSPIDMDDEFLGESISAFTSR